MHFARFVHPFLHAFKHGAVRIVNLLVLNVVEQAILNLSVCILQVDMGISVLVHENFPVLAVESGFTDPAVPVVSVFHNRITVRVQYTFAFFIQKAHLEGSRLSPLILVFHLRVSVRPLDHVAVRVRIVYGYDDFPRVVRYVQIAVFFLALS